MDFHLYFAEKTQISENKHSNETIFIYERILLIMIEQNLLAQTFKRFPYNNI